ncbi:TetR/AcrR family transcriptional regulator [Companilactobacillus kimchii]|uniref:TetR family transcriptional regulator n=2 Tax=Companilactobacillus kimchii TaxID=2801452 RepID=A0ABR5NRG5_9LACO|nr:TetR/AcrR family transcriptional regulator [Companilactobacillus kimchii]GEO48020.1 hypothetical protein LKI01_20190 [Companilactobacillus paralimentarius]KAE9557263.1 hypothetical protein ATN91_03735 [Companilactobacillus kimchii]KAE9559204.1 hypothetical protein ATN91_11165 [Companilactobacillus kimchii]KRK50546.1 TetR family transcriptional regulator [Companilactobacillus kimchii DSM 13961 = JCM 10707]OWF33718.1 hypothetical protein LKACC12383_00858 [Companilactobacillus kimchii]
MTSRTLSREKIVAAAIEIINDQEKLTFTKLSKILGTRSQAIYNYFPDVLTLKVAVVDNFYDQLTQRLQIDLLGLSGKQAIKSFANVSVQFALSHFLVAQQILVIPADRLQDKVLDNRLLVIHEILIKLLNPLIEDQKVQLIISRMLHNLIIGEIIHIENGQFNNKLMSARDSFDKMLDITLLSL